MKWKIGYSWRLREVMATRKIFTATELVPLLKERGIDLSASQVHRLVSGTPERLSLQVLSAFCDILGCTPADLITTTAENRRRPQDRHRRPPGAACGRRQATAPSSPNPPERMSRTYATDEQYERWFKKTCARCGNRHFASGWWPDGPVCRTCHDRALLVRGTCPRCGHHRVLAGVAPDGQPICTDCAGFRTSYRCRRCGHEGKLHARKLCTRCTFADQLTELLGDDTGQILPELAPLFEVLVGMDNPLTGLTWLYRPHVPRFLRGLVTGEIPLSHKAFDTLQPWRAAAYLREILMGCGLLPAVDKQLLLFDRWLAEHLSAIDDQAHRPVVQQFATWKVLPWLRTRAERGPLSPSTRRNAGAQIMRATYLAGRAQPGTAELHPGRA
ncbi:helix-turn-helix transcriptional regulator [Saccharopolyspora sp. ASAGF58]|uniref:helix-turn-helix domain-containing protein n=1 Tax=Saccharopolyspora sp. ASAGF58 TaxID=2719023 RepID=UPI001FF0D3E8|nr:helix-turn-helix transcriptional regulator [Saccharopolyspora sp. ASAGF58]